MRIVEYGHIKPRVVKCNHCGAILEYVPKDIKSIASMLHYFLECPICKEYILKDNNGNYLTNYFTDDDLK